MVPSPKGIFRKHSIFNARVVANSMIFNYKIFFLNFHNYNIHINFISRTQLLLHYVGKAVIMRTKTVKTGISLSSFTLFIFCIFNPLHLLSVAQAAGLLI